MPPSRLSWRGRHVTRLTQEIHDVDHNIIPASLSGDNWLHDEKRQYCIELTGREFTEVFSAIFAGSILIYPDESHRVAWLLWKFFEYPVQCAVSVETIEREVIRYIESTADEEENDMPCLEIVTIGGIPYLQQKCGCDETRFYQLSPASVNAEGLPVSINDGGGSSGGEWDFGGVSDDNASCYAEKATEYLLGRARDFAHAVIDWTAYGIDFAGGNVDEFVEGALLTSALLFGNGDLEDIQAYTKSAVTNALADAEVVSTLESAWTYTGFVTKGELNQWVANAPNSINGVFVREMLRQWLLFSIIPFYNNKLSAFAASCESGNSIPATIVTVIFENASYQLVQISTNDQTFSIVGDILTVTDFQNVAAVLQTATLIGGTGFGNHMQIETNVGTDNLITGTYGGNTDNIGNSYLNVAGTTAAVEFGKAQLEAYSAVVPSPTPPDLPYSGVFSVECVVQQADWVTRLDELYLVIEK